VRAKGWTDRRFSPEIEAGASVGVIINLSTDLSFHGPKVQIAHIAKKNLVNCQNPPYSPV
jgi:hypothetical protein